MAIHTQDRFAQALGINVVSDRINSFIWISATQNDKKLEKINPTKERLRDQLATYLENNTSHCTSLRSYIEQCQPPRESINWITHNSRQLNWLESQIEILNFLRTSTNNWPYLLQTLPATIQKPPYQTEFNIIIPTHLTDRNRYIALLDYWIYTQNLIPEQRTTIAKWLNKLWNQQEKVDQLFEWIKDNNTEQKLTFLWEWLNEKDSTKVYGQQKFQTHEELLIHFDSHMYTDPEKVLISRSSRATWNQRIRRENNKDKKQCNYIFSKSTIAALDKLAHKYHVTRTNIIEILVESEAKHETYIKERLARINSLKQPLD